MVAMSVISLLLGKSSSSEDLTEGIHGDGKPHGEHRREYNALTTFEFGVITVGNDFESRYNVLDKQNERQTDKKTRNILYLADRTTAFGLVKNIKIIWFFFMYLCEHLFCEYLSCFWTCASSVPGTNSCRSDL